MPRTSGFRGTWQPNRRPYVTIAPDVYVALQGETTVIACGECKREININDYLTGISTEASVDSPPGSATINLSVPDNDVNNFYVDGQLLIIPMMEIEIYAKGYFLIGGYPQYYKIFWGLVSSVTKSWSGGSTTININCKDILRWWELTNTSLNPAFLDNAGSSAGGYQLWQNQYAGSNPYTVIINLAKEAMGDFSLSTGSFTSFLPEKGAEGQVIGSYAKDIMAYWQLKFSNIWNSLVLYGSSGQSYQFTGGGGTVSPTQLSQAMFNSEEQLLNQNQQTELFKIHPEEVAVFKKSLDKAGSVEFFQNEIQSKLSVALMARDQSGFEFFCDTTGDIVFKPPFYNLNVLPNKPTSWVQNFEIIDDSVTDSEAEVYTHVVSSGNAFGGVMDWGLNDEICTPRTGVFDFHLLKRYGFRKLDYQTEWAGDPRKLFFHLMDYLDRVNAKRQNGTVTIPMRPELRMGYPIWFPKYDSFFYIQGISHQYSVGGQATTTLTLIAKRSKFIAPDNIGTITKTGTVSVKVRNFAKPGTVYQQVQQPAYSIVFPDQPGATAGLTNTTSHGQPITIRDPNTGKLLGYPNVVMVYRSALDGTILAKILENAGKASAQNPAQQKKGSQRKVAGSGFNYDNDQLDVLRHAQSDDQSWLIQRLRAHRYEAGMTNAGAYDYAHDAAGIFKEMSVIPVGSLTWNPDTNPNNSASPHAIILEGSTAQQPISAAQQATSTKSINSQIAAAQAAVKKAQNAVNTASQKVTTLQRQLATANNKKSQPPVTDSNTSNIASQIAAAKVDAANAAAALEVAQTNLSNIQAGFGTVKKLANLNMILRPVSDEFGFEVIGHYRYGRGAYIDQGGVKVQTSTAGPIANQINIQFAATGGLLTDATQVPQTSTGQVNLPQQLEQMQPEDWVTGASFQGVSGPGDTTVNNVQLTSQQTYTNQMQNNVGTGVYVEADAIRRSTTLGELKPTIGIGSLDNATENCSCGLERGDWLSILPQQFIQKVLGGSQQTVPTTPPITGSVNTTDQGPNNQTVGASPGDGFTITSGSTTGAILGSANPADFFTQLSLYLQQQFDQDYIDNSLREQTATAWSRGIESQLYSATPTTNVLGLPQTSLFDRASQGDPAALQSLENMSVPNFGLTSKESAAFSTAYQNAVNPNQVSNQPPVPNPVPNVRSMILNPSKNTQLQTQQNNKIGVGPNGTPLPPNG